MEPQRRDRLILTAIKDYGHISNLIESQAVGPRSSLYRRLKKLINAGYVEHGLSRKSYSLTTPGHLLLNSYTSPPKSDDNTPSPPAFASPPPEPPWSSKNCAAHDPLELAASVMNLKQAAEHVVRLLSKIIAEPARVNCPRCLLLSEIGNIERKEIPNG